MTRLDQAKQAFHCEVHALLAQMEDALLQLETNPVDTDLIDSVFRATRTIKTTGGVFAFGQIENFTALAEAVLDNMRSGARQIDQHSIPFLMACRDHIAVLVDSAVFDAPLSPTHTGRHAALAQQLRQILGEQSDLIALRPAPIPAAGKDDGANLYDDLWQVFVEFGPDVLHAGIDPMSFLQAMGKTGHLTSVKTSIREVPAFEQKDPRSRYVSYEIGFRSETADKQSIEKIFESVRKDVMISILPPADRMGDMIGAIQQMPEEVGVLGDLLARTGTITQSELDRALTEQKRQRDAGQQPDSIPKLGQLLVQQKAIRPEIVDAAVEKQKKANTRTRLAAGQLPVDANTLNQLIDLVGELVVIGASTRVLAQRHADGQLLNSMTSMSDLAEEIRHNALRLRRG